MTELLSDLSHLGVQLSVAEGQLSIRAPKGAISPELKESLNEHKQSLLALLESGSESAPNGPGAGLQPTYLETPPPSATSRHQEGAPLTGEQILANARRLGPELRRRSDEIEEGRRIPADLAQTLRDAGVFRINMPKIWGGPELTSMEQNEVIEELSRANASVGWCAMIGSDSGIMSSYFDDDLAREMYPRLDMVQAGWYLPVGQAHKVPGGYRVSGKWAVARGCTHADWMSAGCMVYENGKQMMTRTGVPEWRVAVAKPSEFELLDTWHTTGLRGSGSLDYRCEDLFVPAERTFSFYEPPKRPGALYSSPDTYLRKMPGIPLGIARDAIDTVVASMADKREVPTGRPYRDMPRVQSAIAQAEGLYGAARAFLYSSLEAQWESLEAQQPLTKKIRADLWLARINTFQSARQVVQLMYDTVGGGAIYSQKSPLDRHFRDIQTICQHIAGQAKSWEPVGAMMLDPTGATQVPFL